MALFKKSPKLKEAKEKDQPKTGSVITRTDKIENLAHLPAHPVLMKPLQSERAYGLIAKSNQYLFLVKPWANKPEVKKEVESRYGVKVVGVNILKKKGKTKRMGHRLGTRPDLKKAFVTLKEGNKIENF